MMRVNRTITTEDLRLDYAELRNQANVSFKNKEFEKSLFLIEGCAKLAYEYHFIETFCDDELEELVFAISSELFTPDPNLRPKTGKVIFYDYFAIANRGLTQQYLDALIALDYEIIFVISNDYWYNNGSDIVNKIKHYKKGKLIIFSQQVSLVERIIRLSELVEITCPEYVFLHLSPWDVIANGVFSRYNFAKRLFINLTDHAFWLGKKCIDICLEFRAFGFQLSNELRGIEENKLRILPYYPITQSESSFKGFTVDTNSKVIGIAGGSGYKFVGDDWRFFNLISRLLKEHDNFIFFLLGLGGLAKEEYLKRIKASHLESRFILLNERYDIFQLIKNSDIFFGSYPFPGALMTQLASIANKPIVTYTSEKYIFSYINDILPFAKGKQSIIKSDEDYLATCSKLIINAEFRKNYADITARGTIEPECFVSTLSLILKDQVNDVVKLDTRFDMSQLSRSMTEWYLESENSVIRNYRDLIEKYIVAIDNTNVLNSKYPRARLPIKIVFKKVLRRFLPNSLILFVKERRAKVKRPQLFNEHEFKSLGNRTFVSGSFSLMNPKYISIGNNFSSGYNLRIEAIDEYHGERYHPQIKIGDNVIFNSDCHIGAISYVEIGNNVLFASRIFVSDHSHGDIDEKALRRVPYKRPLTTKGGVRICDNVWIGENVCILSGITIGKNSIIGANAVVTRDVPENCVAAGNPARIIKKMQENND